MLVGALSIKILIYDSHSLKAKRGVVKSVKERLKNKFNIAVAEIGYHEQHNYSEIGIATVGSENRMVEETLQKTVNFLEEDHRLEIVEIIRDI